MKGVEVLISFDFAFVQLKLTPTDRATKQLMITFDACGGGFKEIKDIALENYTFEKFCQRFRVRFCSLFWRALPSLALFTKTDG